jgi:hypothetical protein
LAGFLRDDDLIGHTGSFGRIDFQATAWEHIANNAASQAAFLHSRVSVVTGDVRQMHRSPENAGALFQVASQFNLLEMTSYNVTPEQGVTRYKDDHTQGPACAIAAGAATIYRNYFALNLRAVDVGCHPLLDALPAERRERDALNASVPVALQEAHAH